MADLNDPAAPAKAEDKAVEPAATANEPSVGKPSTAEAEAETPAAETPAAEKPAAEKPAAEKVALETPAEPVAKTEPAPDAVAAAGPAATDAVPAAGPAKEAKRPRKPLSRPRPIVAALSLLLVVLLVAGVALFVHNHKASSAAASRLAALDTARDVATSLTTITPDNAAGQIDDLTKHSTGSLKDQIGGYSAMFQAVLKQGNVSSRGTITAAGIEKMEGDAASAIVAVSALITSGQVPQGQPRTYRLLVSLQRSGDQWLASNVDFMQ